ncbi:MAG: DUF72 domain-containing protein [Actinomycetota bacterium]|nr:DUF72 domain-containing protein [Actinomycetota bacterium]
MGLYVGTSGWAYREWKPGFYPPNVPQRRFLEHYAAILGACEINATFYQLQTESTMQRWAAASPPGFRFTIKAHRRLTHAKVIGNAEFLGIFLNSLQPLTPHLGAILFQFPPHRQRDDDALGRLLATRPAHIPYAFEFRHESWNYPEVAARIAGAGATVCVAETSGALPQALPEGPIAYVRLRSERYGRRARSAWRRALTEEGSRRDTYAFTKHEGLPSDDPYGGVGLAAWLASTSKPAPPRIRTQR